MNKNATVFPIVGFKKLIIFSKANNSLLYIKRKKVKCTTFFGNIGNNGKTPARKLFSLFLRKYYK